MSKIFQHLNRQIVTTVGNLFVYQTASLLLVNSAIQLVGAKLDLQMINRKNFEMSLLTFLVKVTSREKNDQKKRLFESLNEFVFDR